SRVETEGVEGRRPDHRHHASASRRPPRRIAHYRHDRRRNEDRRQSGGRSETMKRCVAWLVVVLFAAPAAAQTPRLPDWSGVWRLKGSPALLDVEDGKSFVPGVRDHPPYKPDWEEKYKVDLVRSEHQGNSRFR